jgi:hypothetical protein
MKVERDVIIDLLPAYFSGEASTATRALVEDYFRQDPEFEKMARAANGPMESLKVPVAALDQAREKLALERARQVTQTRSSFLWLAVCFSVLLLLFRISDHKIVWIMWQGSPTVGMVFSALAVFFWFGFLRLRGRKEPLPPQTTFLWLAVFYTLLTFLFKVRDHKVVWIFLGAEPTTGLIFITLAAALWVVYFIQRWKAKRAGM